MRKSLFSIIDKKPRPSDNPFNSVMFNDGSQSENGLKKIWNFPEKGRKKTEEWGNQITKGRLKERQIGRY